jgi:hypothetical protein
MLSLKNSSIFISVSEKKTLFAGLYVRVGIIFSSGKHLHVTSQEKRNETCPILKFTFHYIDDALSLNNSRFGYFADRIYPIELEDTTNTDRSACKIFEVMTST